MLDKNTADRDANKIMHVLQAVQWGIAVWANDITLVTIANCWLKARVLGPDYRPLTKAQAKEQERREQEVAFRVNIFLLFFSILF
jgi:hypothetical protein